MKKLKEYAKEHRVTYKTAWNRFKAGKIPGAIKDSTGYITIPEKKDLIDYKQSIIYCRISNNKQSQKLERQVERVKQYAICNGYQIIKIVREIGDGLDDNRKKLIKLFNNSKWNTLIIEHKDILMRFGFNFIEELLKISGRKILVIRRTIINLI